MDRFERSACCSRKVGSPAITQKDEHLHFSGFQWFPNQTRVDSKEGLAMAAVSCFPHGHWCHQHLGQQCYGHRCGSWATMAGPQDVASPAQPSCVARLHHGAGGRSLGRGFKGSNMVKLFLVFWRGSTYVGDNKHQVV